MSISDELPTPEAGALISFNRVNGSKCLFGSPFVHQGYVMMRVKQCTLQRSTGATWYFGRKEYIEVAMSYSQFAEAITTMNVGDGVPCTIQHLNGVKFPQVEVTDERKLYDKELSNSMAQAEAAIKDTIDAIEELSIPKKHKDVLLRKIGAANRALKDSMPFIAKEYAEYMDGVEGKAKTEVSAYIDMALRQEGISSIKALDSPQAQILQIKEHEEKTDVDQ